MLPTWPEAEIGHEANAGGLPRNVAMNASVEVLKRITVTAMERGLSFLVVGGHALNAWGVSRQTCDLDLMVPGNERKRRKVLLGELDYLSPQELEAFVQ
jgi:hypothetical protein